MFDLPPGVEDPHGALEMLRRTQDLLVWSDVQAVTGWASPVDLQGALEQLLAQFAGTPWPDVQEIQEGLDAHEGTWRQLESLSGQQGDGAGFAAEVRALFQACPWQGWPGLHRRLSGEPGAEDLVSHLCWVATGQWLHVYGWLRFEAGVLAPMSAGEM